MAIVRTPMDKRFRRERGTGDYFTTDDLPTDLIEYLEGDAWKKPEPYAGGGKVVGPLRYLSDKLGDVGEGFVSALERVIASSKQDKMPAEQWQKYLAPGRKVDVEDVPFTLKKDELDWSNLPGLFGADPKAPRTAAELLEHLNKRNLPEFDERRGASSGINFGAPITDEQRRAADRYIDNVTSRYEDEEGELTEPELVYRIRDALLGDNAVDRGRAYEDLLDEGHEDAANEIRRIMTGNKGVSDTQHEDWVTRGPKAGYEENLTKWTPTHRNKINEERRDIDRRADELRNQINTDQSLSKEQRDALGLREHSLRQHSMRLHASMPEDTGNGPAFKSTHFDELEGASENLLSHSRASRRGDRNVLYDAEGKEYRHNSPEDVDRYLSTLPEHLRSQYKRGPGIRLIEEIQSDWHQAGRDKGYNVQKNPLSPEERAEHEALDARDFLPTAEGRRFRELNERAGKAVPYAPYKKTYPELEFRKQLLRAIAEGDEYLAWTPGEEQINRYDSALRQAVSEIGWVKKDDGTWNVLPYRRGMPGTRINTDERLNDLDERGLRNLLGKDMADQIISSDEGVGTLEGSDLRIGGSGMRHFYDSVIPEIAQKIARTYGGEITEVPIPKSVKGENYRGEPSSFPALRITPAMRDRVRRIGVPLFGGAPAIPLSEIDFDGDGADYDYARAVGRGIVPDDTGHWPSRSELEDDEADAMGLPWGSGVLMKGRAHETWPLTEQGEADAGYKIVKKGRRYFSVPADVEVGDE